MRFSPETTKKTLKKINLCFKMLSDYAPVLDACLSPFIQ